MPMGPGRFSRAEELDFCGSCHRLPEMITPGAIRTDNPALVRHQPVGLMQSACYKKSHGVLTCRTCHDPHALPPATAPPMSRSACPAISRVHRPFVRFLLDQGASTATCPAATWHRGMMLSDHWIRKLSPEDIQLSLVSKTGLDRTSLPVGAEVCRKPKDQTKDDMNASGVRRNSL